MKRLSILILSFCLFSCTKNEDVEQNKAPNKFYNLAYEYRDNYKTDSAFFYFLKARDLAILQKDSLTVGSSLLNLAILSADRRDDFTSQEFSLAALTYLDKKNQKHHPYLSSNYNCLGMASQNLRDYANALIFFDLALSFSKKPDDVNLYLNNKAYLYQETKQYHKALAIYTRLEKTTVKNGLAYARLLSNSSFTQWLLNSNFNALPKLLEARYIREGEKDLWGLNSSYDYLSDYHSKSNADSALLYAHKMYGVAKQLNSSDDQLYALQKLIKLSSSPLKNKYFESYLKLDDSAQKVRNADKNQFALIRYGVEESKADNLKLQKENSDKRYQIIIITVASILIFIIGLFWYRKRQQHLKLTAEKTIKENQLRTSKKVHDVVANGLYRIMTKLDNQEILKNDPIVDEIEELYEKSRDISYDKFTNTSIGFHDKIQDLLNVFASANIKVQVKGNTIPLWQNISTKVQYEIEHILQELMVNMTKHSQASMVTISFERLEKQINIYYTDNGIGISKNVLFKNGLTNTGNRIDNISGNITFETKTEKGLEVHISFPIS